ncbi:MAG: hypothetical protein EZS28_018801, partial [Streblomastix strix]
MQLPPYKPPSKGGKPSLWEDPRLEDIQSHVERVRSLPINFPPEGEFQFINIFGSSLPTLQHLVLLHITTVKHLAEYCEYMSHGHDAFRTRRGIKKLIDSTQKRQISPPPFHRT